MMPTAAIIMVAPTNKAMACKVCFAKKTLSPFVRVSGHLESVMVNSLSTDEVRADSEYDKNFFLISRKR
ncbi:hypothetical protein FFE93_003405 [Yersinia sp. KBS0713]|nr:hypothetical protein FFE93_003405 [Yersinia sp. KBS0713]